MSKLHTEHVHGRDIWIVRASIGNCVHTVLEHRSNLLVCSAANNSNISTVQQQYNNCLELFIYLAH